MLLLLKSDNFEHIILLVFLLLGWLSSAKVFPEVAGRFVEGVFPCLCEVLITTEGGHVHLRVICLYQRGVVSWWLKLEVGVGAGYHDELLA